MESSGPAWGRLGWVFWVFLFLMHTQCSIISTKSNIKVQEKNTLNFQFNFIYCSSFTSKIQMDIVQSQWTQWPQSIIKYNISYNFHFSTNWNITLLHFVNFHKPSKLFLTSLTLILPTLTHIILSIQKSIALCTAHKEVHVSFKKWGLH